MTQATFQASGAATKVRRRVQDYTADLGEGMVVLDCVTRFRQRSPHLGLPLDCKAGKCGSCSAEINGKPRLMCMTRMDGHRHVKPGETIILEPMHTFPLIGDLVTDVSWNYRVNKMIPAFQPRKPDARTAPGA